MPRPEKHVFVCTHLRPADHPKGSCAARGGEEILDLFANEFETRELWERFKLTKTGCLGTCEQGPTVLVYPEGVMYQKVVPDDVVTIIEEHILGDQPVERLKMPADVWS
jgi:(2Fe-2S) ferredoxin